MNPRVEWALWWCNMMIAMKKKTLAAASVLAEPQQMSATGNPGADRSGEARESSNANEASSLSEPREGQDSRGGSQSFMNKPKVVDMEYHIKPSNIPLSEWREALDRADRAREYAAMFPIRPHDLQFQDPMWQWENRAQPFDGRKQ